VGKTWLNKTRRMHMTTKEMDTFRDGEMVTVLDEHLRKTIDCRLDRTTADERASNHPSWGPFKVLDVESNLMKDTGTIDELWDRYMPEEVVEAGREYSKPI
jgi:hypothetical protein